MIAGAGLLVSVITAIFGHHAAAVAQEAKTLNDAVPAFITGIQAIFAAVNSGQLTPQQALSVVDEAVQTYYQQVGSIMKKGQACQLNADCSLANSGTKPGGVNFEPCNGPCSVGCTFIEPTACQAKKILSSPTGGSYTVPASGAPHAGFNGWPSFTFSWTPSAASSVGSSIGSLFGGSSAGGSSLVPWLLAGLAVAKVAGVF